MLARSYRPLTCNYYRKAAHSLKQLSPTTPLVSSVASTGRSRIIYLTSAARSSSRHRLYSSCTRRLSQRSFATCVQEPQKSHQNDTIYALSTAQGKAGIAVVRISGPACQKIYNALCPTKPLPKPRYASVRTLYEPLHASLSSSTHKNDDILDTAAMVLNLPGPRTVTGEDILELHVHGGIATVKAVLLAISHTGCGSFHGEEESPLQGPRNRNHIRYAEPGEFTMRAFLNSRLDLTQVESLSDSLSAETEQQRRAAVRGASGALGRIYEDWRQQLLNARAEIEALIDFSEDQHFDESPGELLGSVSGQVRSILQSIERHEDAGQRGELLRDGVRIALLGPPNVGKSSLMNLIVGREASIVSGEAGTTRDVVEARLDIRGYLCTFADTAGFRGAKARSTSPAPAAATPPEGFEVENQIGAIEREGIRRARSKAMESDVVVVVASIEPQSSGEGHFIQYDKETLSLLDHVGRGIIVINKTDTISPDDLSNLLLRTSVFSSYMTNCRHGNGQQVDKKHRQHSRKPSHYPGTHPGSHPEITTIASSSAATTPTPQMFSVSCRKEQTQSGSGGIQRVVDGLLRLFGTMTELPVDAQDLLGVTARQRGLLAQCRGHLEDYVEHANIVHSPSTIGRDFENELGCEPDMNMVVAAEDLRYAANCLARITGKGETGNVEEVLGVIFQKFCVGK